MELLKIACHSGTNSKRPQIDKADLPAVTKFAYLKELVEPRVKRGIDGLPVSPEGYERAKNILKANYEKTSEIINAYVENILAAKIHDFYDTVVPCAVAGSAWQNI